MFCINELRTHRNLLKALIRRDLFEKLVGSKLGAVWNILQPIVLMGLYILLFSVFLNIKVGENNSHLDYGIFLFSGMIAWLPLQEAIQKSFDVLTKYRHLITQIRFPLLILPMHIACVAILQEILLLTIFSCLLIWKTPFTNFEPLQLLFMVPIKFMFVLGVCLFASFIGVHSKDSTQVLQLALTSAFFISPVVYPLSRVPEWLLPYYQMNPMVGFIETIRFSLLGTSNPGLETLAFCIGSAILLYILGLTYFRAHQHKVVEVL
ncbi:MAG: ABC transporter permease [Candidatus Cloacimonetes bacterium]|nr:ABC transporter permease [Candidatus Cloacimonadota bacterium]